MGELMQPDYIPARASYNNLTRTLTIYNKDDIEITSFKDYELVDCFTREDYIDLIKSHCEEILRR